MNVRLYGEVKIISKFAMITLLENVNTDRYDETISFPSYGGQSWS